MRRATRFKIKWIKHPHETQFIGKVMKKKQERKRENRERIQEIKKRNEQQQTLFKETKTK